MKKFLAVLTIAASTAALVPATSALARNGADDAAGHQRQGRGKDDPAGHGRIDNGTLLIIAKNGADDPAGDQRRGRGKDDPVGHG